MARKRNSKRPRHEKDGEVKEYDALVRFATAIVLVAAGVLLALAGFGSAGPVGDTVFGAAYAVVGVGAFCLPLALVAIGISAGMRRPALAPLTASGIALLLAGVLAFAGLTPDTHWGGIAGNAIGRALESFFGIGGAVVLLLAIVALGIAVLVDLERLAELFLGWYESLMARGVSDEDDEPVTVVGIPDADEDEEDEEEPAPEREPTVNIFNERDLPPGKLAKPGIANFDAEYSPPPLSLLGSDKGKPEVGDIKANANIIKRTFQNFGISVEMDEVSVGPTVTRYAVKPAEGVRLSKIVSLASNLELALAAHPVRIEAPIPGKSLVGIEVPNASKATVGLGGLLAAHEWGASGKPLLAALGRDISGAPHYVNIAKMPHALVAGATGSGKTCGKDTYVFSEKGIVSFDELCPLPDNSETGYAIRVATRDGIETTSKNYNNGVCDFYKITTEDGFCIEVTEEHPLWVIRDGTAGWKSGGKIQIGECVAIARGAKLFGSEEHITGFTQREDGRTRGIKLPERMTEALGLFMGLLSADGGLSVKNRIVYTQANPEVLALYQRLLADLFGITAQAVVKSGQSNAAKDVVVHSANLARFLAHLGMRPVRAQEKEIPLSIRRAKREVVRAYIQGLMRNDGHVSSVGLEITLANEKLLKQLQIILLDFGIVASLHPKKVKGYEKNAYWRLSVFGADFALYAGEIGFLTEEERTRARRATARNRNTNKDLVPTLARTFARLALAYRNAFARLTNGGWRYQAGMPVPKYAFASMRSYASGLREPSYGALDRALTFYRPLAASEDYQSLAEIRDSRFYWAKVARIERTRGVGYDFEVPGSHSFVGNGFVNHNSVAIHALITSLLYRNGPNQLRFILIDPKRVELTAYNGIPHLLAPVITDPKKTIFSLKWAAKEMERRYNILEAERVRDIESYHKTVYDPAKKDDVDEMPEALPYIVIVIDELADIMSSYPRELEAAVVRLAQMSRAVGIHLVLSTQRPSVNVITGLIKANVPTRLALQVASQIDSRTILDGGGAETLLGAGDMLYLSSDMQKPVRLQTAFISEGEVRRIVAYIKGHNAGDLASIDMGGSGIVVSDAADAIGLGSMGEDDEIDDDLYEDARRSVEEAGRASTSYLQRKLKIGYSRAARLMDVLESRGVIGAADGSKPREVLSRGGVAAEPDDADETF